ncbi:fibronectin type III domain-containing protein, partial [Flavobacteriales bacterium]|nr:fibronectin type III domain-containing protein [Flavobacteriales bacterium]
QSCASAIALTPGTAQSGNTSTFGDLFDNNPCLGFYDGGDDAIYSFTATSDGDELAIDIQGADTWSGASLTAGCPDTASSCLAYDTYGSSHIFGSGPLVGGVTYYLHISTWPTPQATAYTINSVFTPAPSCFAPTLLTSSNITTSSADFLWTAGATETAWQVQYDTLGFVPGTGNFAISNDTSYSISGLAAGTSYDCYVRAICAVGDTSAWSLLNILTIGDCSSSGSYAYGNNEDASNAISFVANNPGDYITLTFTAGTTESCCDDWYITDSVNGAGNVIATGAGSIVGAYESPTGIISFYIDSDGSVGGQSFVYSLSCSAPPSCFDPTDFIVGNITTTTANISWTDSTSVSSWNTEYGPAGFTQGSGTSTVISSPSLSLTGLTQGTTYWVYVQSACTNGAISGFAGAAFTTSCGVNTAPWNESFSSTMPNCWSESGSQSASYAGVLTGDNWNFTDYNAYAGYYVHIGGNYQDLTPFPFGYCAFVNGNEGDSAYAPTTLTSPEVSVVPLTSPELSFLLNSNRETETVNALLTVEAHNGSGTWDSIASFQGNTNGWIRQHVSLSAYSGDTVQVRFVYSEPDTAQLDHIAIDEITIGEAATCFEISNLSLSNVTGSSVDLDWSAGGSEASWDILASSSSGNVSSQSTDTSYTLTGLSGATNYNVYVRAVCGVGDTSVWYGPVSLFTYPDGPTGVTCGIGDTNATVFTDGLEAQGGWTGDFGAGNGIWKLGTGGTPSGGTGPDVAHEGSSYFFFESSTGSSQFDTATIYSPLIDLSNAVGGSAELSFWLHAYGNDMGNLHVGASSTLTGTYTNLAIFSGQIQGSSSLAYANLGLDLSAYAGDTVFLSFTYTRNPLGGFTQDLAIDLIEVNSCIVPPPHEMAIVAAAVASGCDLTATEPIELWVVNQGLVAESSFDLSYSVNGGTAVVENITSTLNVGDTLMHVFAATADMSADGVYNLDFGLVLALDSDTSNNSMMLSAENYLSPAALTTMGDTICNGETAMVTTVANGKAFWYDALTGGNLVGNGDNLDVSPTVTTSYYVEDAVVIGHSENFDSYTAGGYIVANDPENWAVWPGGGSAVDMPISDVQGNGGNSLRVFNMDGTDVVMEFGEAISTGLFNYSMDMYLVGDGYINFQEDVVIGTTWNMSVTFIGGVIDVEIDGASVLTGSFTSIDPAGNTVWNNFKFECDYSTGTWEVFADGVSQGTFVNPDPVASVNIYPGTGVEYYLDNVEWAAVTDDACRSARTEAVVTVEDCSSINELSFKDLSIYPNPNNGQFTITNSQEMTELIITDLQGKVILNNVNINLNKMNVDLTDFERGIYMINIKTIDGMITKTVTVQ